MECVATPSSRGSSQPSDQIHITSSPELQADSLPRATWEARVSYTDCTSLPLPSGSTEAVTKGCTQVGGRYSMGQIRLFVSIILNLILWIPLCKEKPVITHLQTWGDADQEWSRLHVAKCFLKHDSPWYSWGIQRCCYKYSFWMAQILFLLGHSCSEIVALINLFG